MGGIFCLGTVVAIDLIVKLIAEIAGLFFLFSLVYVSCETEENQNDSTSDIVGSWEFRSAEYDNTLTGEVLDISSSFTDRVLVIGSDNRLQHVSGDEVLVDADWEMKSLPSLEHSPANGNTKFIHGLIGDEFKQESIEYYWEIEHVSEDMMILYEEIGNNFYKYSLERDD